MHRPRFSIFASLYCLLNFSPTSLPLAYGLPTQHDHIHVRDISQIDNASAAAIIYGYPLFPYIELVYPLLNTTGANALTTYPLATTESAVIVRPNVDTLYAAAPIDLSQTDVSLTIPSVPVGRFYVFPFYDSFGNNFANLGSVNSTTPGKYLLRQGTNTFGLELCDDESEYNGYVNFPTTYGLMFPRFVIDNNTTDVATVNSYRDQVVLATVPRFGSCSTNTPPLSQALLNTTLDISSLGNIFPGNLNDSSLDELLRLTASLVPYNLPENRSQASMVSQFLATAGVSDGVYTRPADLNVTLVGLLVNETLASVINVSNFQDFGNNWRTPPANSSGDFHNDYATRAYIGWSGYLQLAPYEALYPEYIGPLSAQVGTNQLSVTANQSLLFSFSGKPPVNGFWSLTAYGSDNYLIPNALGVHSLGDRSNMTYANGTPLYGNSSDSSMNGTFQILMQPANTNPPANWTNNWLPAPADGGVFSVNLRYYGPSEAFENGSYIEPVVTRQGVFGEAVA